MRMNALQTTAALVTSLALTAPLTASAQAPITLDAPETEPPVPRLRLGGELGFGLGHRASQSLAVAGFLQIGAQLTRQVGLFYQGGLLGFGFASDQEGVDPYAQSSHSAMVDLTFGNVAQVGLGGGFDYGGIVLCDEDTSLCSKFPREVRPSMSLRAAFLVGFVRDHARWGIPIALHAHTILWDHAAQNALLITVGFSRY